MTKMKKWQKNVLCSILVLYGAMKKNAPSSFWQWLNFGQNFVEQFFVEIRNAPHSPEYWTLDGSSLPWFVCKQFENILWDLVFESSLYCSLKCEKNYRVTRVFPSTQSAVRGMSYTIPKKWNLWREKSFRRIHRQMGIVGHQKVDHLTQIQLQLFSSFLDKTRVLRNQVT